MDFYSQTLYAPDGLSDLGLETPGQLDGKLGMEAYAMRRRTDGSPMPLTRQTERALACAAIRGILGEDVLEHVEFTSSGPSGPSRDLWKPPSYTIRIPSGGPDPLMPASANRIVASVLTAIRDSVAAFRYVSGDVPFPADAFNDEADAIRMLRKMAANTKGESGLPNLGLGKDFDLDAAILSHEKDRFASGIFAPVMSFPQDTLESCLVTLDTAAGIVERNKPVPVSFPATPPDPDFMAGKGVIEQQDLPSIAAHLCAYAYPAPRSVSRSMGAPVRLYREGAVRDIMCGFPPMDRPAPDEELIEAVLLPFETAAAVLAELALAGDTSMDDKLAPDELQCLDALRADPDPARIRRTVAFLAGLHALAASLEDPWAVRTDLYGKLLQAVTGGKAFEEWIADELEAALEPLPDEPGTGAALADAYGKTAKAASYDPSTPFTGWTPPSAGLFPDGDCIRYCDLPGLAEATVRDALSDSPAKELVRSIYIARNAPVSGAAPTKSRSGLSLIVSVGEPAPDGSARDPSEDVPRALGPAPDAAVLQAVVSACQAVRRAEQAAMWSGSISADTAVGKVAAGDPDPASRAAKLGLDAQADAFRKASGTFAASDAFRDAYGFDLASAMAAWRNLMAGNIEAKSTDPASAAELLDRLANLL